jgi:glycine/D-amino acid oxidase-like deaminating enzyme
MRRREFVTGLAIASGSGAVALSAETAAPAKPANTAAAGEPPAPDCHVTSPTVASADGAVPLPLVRAQMDRIIALTVCTRPFRAGGARIETERLGRKTIVHNYGHGGSGWSLSWGSATLAVRHALNTRERQIAVIGCGVIGLTSALLAQRAGLTARIYAKDLPPNTRSTFATGNWSPNSRYCSAEGATPEVAARWEEMARSSFRMYQSLLGLPGDPIEWRDGYFLSDGGSTVQAAGEPAYPALEQRIADITPHSQELAPGTHPFPVQYVRRYTNMIFNISEYTRMLVADFLAAGGVIETREFEKPGDIARLREKTVINATGYGARALFGDETLTPVRGQLMRLIPQPEVTYGLTYGDVFYMVPRRDGIILQSQAPGDFGNADNTPDRAAAERTVQAVTEFNQRIRQNVPCA